MKKYVFISALLLLLNSFTLAQTATEKEVANIAISFFAQNYGDMPIINETESLYAGDTLCLYRISMSDGKWCLVPASKSAPPIMAYGLSEVQNLPENNPYDYFINYYKNIVRKRLNSSRTYSNEYDSWNNLLNNNQMPKTFHYNGDNLLDVTGRGGNIWQQTRNNDESCSPSYNQECPTNDNVACGYSHVGCGAIALGQVLWYWSWTKKTSPYWNTNWGLLPNSLHSTTPIEEVTELTKFLRNCGNAVRMDYSLGLGSWCTLYNIEDALIDTFGYEGARKFTNNEWSYGDSWVDLIKSEIDNGRPVIYYGDNPQFWNGHYFVVDGYKDIGRIIFHANFGHGDNLNGMYFLLDNFHDDAGSYDLHNKAIVGIAPTMEYNVTDVPYETMNFSHSEFASQFIQLPSIPKTLTIDENSYYVCSAGDSIVLKPGFSTERGSNATFNIDTKLSSRMAISVDYWPNALNLSNPNGLYIVVKNADSWEFWVYDRSNQIIFQSAGNVIDGVANVWDGSGALTAQNYTCAIRFKNSFGRILENTFSLIATPNFVREDNTLSNNDSIMICAKNDVHFIEEDTTVTSVKLNPNPSTGLVNFEIDGPSPTEILIYDSRGNLCYSDKYLNANYFSIDLSSFNKGLYLVKIKFNNNSVTKKLVLI